MIEFRIYKPEEGKFVIQKKEFFWWFNYPIYIDLMGDPFTKTYDDLPTAQRELDAIVTHLKNRKAFKPRVVEYRDVM